LVDVGRSGAGGADRQPLVSAAARHLVPPPGTGPRPEEGRAARPAARSRGEPAAGRGRPAASPGEHANDASARTACGLAERPSTRGAALLHNGCGCLTALLSRIPVRGVSEGE